MREKRKEPSQRDLRIRSLAILSGLAFMFVVCLIPGGRRQGQTARTDTVDYYARRMDEALDTMIASRFMAGTTVYQKGTIEELSERDDLEDRLERLEVRLSVYAGTPQEYRTDALRSREAELGRQIDSIRMVLSNMDEGASSSRERVRRVGFRQPDGDCYTAFQRIDGKCTRSELMNLTLIEH